MSNSSFREDTTSEMVNKREASGRVYGVSRRKGLTDSPCHEQQSRESGALSDPP